MSNKCEWRDKPGGEENCQMMKQADSIYCPRPRSPSSGVRGKEVAENRQSHRPAAVKKPAGTLQNQRRGNGEKRNQR